MCSGRAFCLTEDQQSHLIALMAVTTRKSRESPHLTLHTASGHATYPSFLLIG